MKWRTRNRSYLKWEGQLLGNNVGGLTQSRDVTAKFVEQNGGTVVLGNATCPMPVSMPVSMP